MTSDQGLRSLPLFAFYLFNKNILKQIKPDIPLIGTGPFQRARWKNPFVISGLGNTIHAHYGMLLLYRLNSCCQLLVYCQI